MHYRYASTPGREAHYRAIRRVLWVTLWLNLAVALAKASWGWATGSLAMKADGFHSFFDAASNVVGLVALTVAAQPPDKEHQYGHYKYEVVASMAISLLLFSGAYTLLTEAASRWNTPQIPRVTPVSFAIMIVTMGINAGVSRYEEREGSRLKSPILLADARHTWSDVFASLSVIAALAFSRLGWAWADLAVALFISLVIARAAYHIIAQGLMAIGDAAMLDPREVRALITAIPEVREAHRVRTRGAAGHIFMDCHVEVDPNLTIAEGHRIVLSIERKLAETYPGMTDITVHLDPWPAEKYEPQESETARIAE